MPEPDFLQRIDPICDQFERACQQGEEPEIISFLGGWEGPSRTELFRHLLELQLDYWRRAGNRPDVEQVAQQYSEFAPMVQQIFTKHLNPNVETSANQRLAETHVHGPPAGKSSASQSTALPPQFGRYQIQRTLGEGGMGSVYLALDTELQRQVALKVPKFIAGKDEELIKRFYREARAAAALHHRNICPVFDIGELSGTRYITMAYVDGRSLSDHLHGGKSLAPKTAARLIAKLATALAEAHRHGVVHRDLKPSNIMIDQHREPVIMDFGLARHVESGDATQLTHSGMIIGTPAYMAPEQTSGRIDDIGPACDIYSLGVVLYQLITGRLPFEGDLMVLLSKIANEEPPPPSSLREEIDPALETICLRMMAKQPVDRYASMNDVAAALEEYIASGTTQTIRVSETVRTTRKPQKPAGAKMLPWAIGGAALALASLLALVGLAMWFFSGPSQEPTKGQVPIETASAPSTPAPPVAKVPFDAPQARQHQTNWAKHLGFPPTQTNSLGMTLVLIPPGEFDMGSTEDEVADAVAEAEQLNLGDHYVEFIESEAPLTQASIDVPYYIGRTEVTVGQFKRFVQDTGYQTTAETNGLGGYGFVSREQAEGFNWRNAELDQTDEHPVINVTLADAEQFCHWLSRKEGVKYSLPNETQWEFACRAGTTTRWSCGESGLDKFAWYWDNSDHTTHPVATKSPNAFGLYDMHGNVREWCARIKGAPETGILRGGAFLKPPLLLRSAQRIAFKAVTPYPYHGFRVVAPAQRPSE